ncbi:LacI family DNA-binding transcriptional regulator [Rhodococcus aerolatus]
MTDVAQLAGVSHQTVSRVLNGHPSVTERTRRRVQEAVHELDYRRNTAARALVTGRSHVLGVVGTGSALHGPVSTLYGVEAAARAAGYTVSVASAPSIDPDAVVAAVGRLQEQGVDGVVVIAPLRAGADRLAELAERLPLVVVEGSPAGALDVVAVDQEAGAREATEHLLGLGHRTVWHVTGQDGWFESAQRVDGWRAALEAAGAEVPPLLTGDWTARSGYEAGLVLARMPEVTAVFAANDSTALGVFRALAERGRRVPEDVSVVGFDDVPDAAYLTPPLTTVRQDFAEVGRCALAALLEQLDRDGPDPVRSRIPAELVVRGSTTAPGGG